ncbi:MAG: GDSL-type esterase/lipase family protein [Verrucomicrobiota bacterium]
MKPLLALVLGFAIAASSQAATQDAPPIKDGKAAKLACVGDSITEGFGVIKGRSWPDQIAKMLGSTCEVRNFGVGGRQLLSYQSTEEFQNAKNFNPDVVVIMLGTNDVRPMSWKGCKSNFVTDYLAMIKQFAERPSKPRIFICYPPTITEADGSEENILELIPLMDEVARQAKVGIIDIHGAFKGKAELIPDKIHPNDAGQTLIATTVHKALTASGESIPVRSPGSGNDQWYRGNTHTHAKFSDDNDVNDVPTISSFYKAAGYQFLLLSEHNNHVAKKQVFQHDEAGDKPSFIMLCGLELSRKRHLTALGIDRFIGDENSLQDGVSKTIKAGGVPILNHPQDPPVPAKNFIATAGLNHLEVFNGKRPGDTPSTEKLWDSILSAPDGRQVFAVAADDNHYDKAAVGRGWIMVKSPSLTPSDIVENIRTGNFYASTGVILNDYQVSKKAITVDSQNGNVVTFIGKDGVVLSTTNQSKAVYDIKGDELYIRAKITNSEGKAAWTQPVFVKWPLDRRGSSTPTGHARHQIILEKSASGRTTQTNFENNLKANMKGILK